MNDTRANKFIFSERGRELNAFINDNRGQMSANKLLREVYEVGYQDAEADSKKKIAELEEALRLRDELTANESKQFIELQAHVNRLKRVLYYYREECTGFEPSISVFNLMLDEALASTPAQSLQEHDSKFIEQINQLEKKLDKKSSDDSWAGAVDRQSGAFTDEEVERCRNGGW